MILSFASSLMNAWNRRQHFRLPPDYLKLLILLNFLHLPTTFAQGLYSPCSQACIETQDAAFSIPSGAVANNQAVCNNEPFLKATAQCIYQNCGEHDLSVTVGLFISACTTTDTPTSYTSQELIAFGSEGASSASVSTTGVPLSTTVPPSVVTVGTTDSTFIVSTIATPTPSVATTGASPTGAFSSTSSSKTSTTSSSKHSLSGGAIAGITIGAVIALALVAFIILGFLRNNRKIPLAQQSTAVIDDSGKTAGYGKGEMDGESKPVIIVSSIPVSEGNPTAAPTSNTPTPSNDASHGMMPVTSTLAPKQYTSYPMMPCAEEMPANNATLQEGPPLTPAELDQHPSANATQPLYLSGSVTTPQQELPAYYKPHFEMAADVTTTIHAETENDGDQAPPTRGGVMSDSTGSGVGVEVGVMRAPDEELAWLEAEEEKIRKRKSELKALRERSW